MQIPEIKNALKEALRDPNRRASYFIGGMGSGKSTLLAQTFKEVIRRPTYCFVVNGEVVYEAMADDPTEMRFIENIKKCITGFIRK